MGPTIAGVQPLCTPQRVADNFCQNVTSADGRRSPILTCHHVHRDGGLTLSRQELHFDHGTAAWAARGAVVGFVLVLAAFAAVIVMNDEPLELFAVGLLSAGFGGVGMGAMLGATLAAVRSSDEHR